MDLLLYLFMVDFLDLGPEVESLAEPILTLEVAWNMDCLCLAEFVGVNFFTFLSDPSLAVPLLALDSAAIDRLEEVFYDHISIPSFH